MGTGINSGHPESIPCGGEFPPQERKGSVKFEPLGKHIEDNDISFEVLRVNSSNAGESSSSQRQGWVEFLAIKLDANMWQHTDEGNGEGVRVPTGEGNGEEARYGMQAVRYNISSQVISGWTGVIKKKKRHKKTWR